LRRGFVRDMQSVAVLLQSARSMQLSPQMVNSGMVTYKIRFGIKCLEAALLQTPTPQQNLEILYELANLYFCYTKNYQRVEDCIQKALIIASQSIDNEYVFKLWDLQIKLYLATDKVHLAKQSVKSSISNSQDQWNTLFHFRKLELHRKTNDWEGFLHSSNQLILQLSLPEDIMTVLLQRAQFAFESTKMDFVDQALQEFENVNQKADQNDEMVQYMNTMKIMMQITRLEFLGQLKQVPPLIVQLHSSIVQPGLLGAYAVNSNFYTRKHIPYLMAYLVSGIAHKTSDNNRSKMFFEEGLKAVELELNREVTFQSPKDWFGVTRTLKLIHIFCTLQLVEVCLLRCEFIEVFNHLYATTKLCCEKPEFLQQFRHFLMLGWAMLLQCVGEDSKAISFYKKLECIPSFSWIAKLHLYILDEHPVV
jgi:tetratricopeptide (TPR) repeat protein